jgi:hypothetical protein
MNKFIFGKNINDSVKKNITPHNKYFYDNIINYFENNKINTIIKENIYELTGLILYLLSNSHKYHIGIIINKDIPNNVIYREKNLNTKQLVNLYYCLTSNDFIGSSKKIKENNVIYICISKTPMEFDITPSKINYCSLTQLFGIENFNILNYINFKRFIELSKTKLGKHSFNELKKYKNKLSNYPDNVSSYCSIWGSTLLFVFGTTTSYDVDELIYNYHDNKQIIKLSKELTNEKMDVTILNKNRKWTAMDINENRYWMSTELSKKWVEYVNAKNIEDIFINSRYHFYMFGVKFISFDLFIYKLHKRNSPTSYADLLAIDTFNIKGKLPKCTPIIRYRGGVIDIIDNQKYNKMLKTIIKYMKDWHNIHYSIEKLKQIFPLCSYEPFNKYITTINTHNLFNNLRKFHQYIKELYLIKYCHKCDLLLDIGSGYLKSLRFWKKAQIKKIIAMEPSESLYKSGREFQKKNIFAKKNIIYLQSVGNKNWLSGNSGLNNKSKEILKKLKGVKANCITFEFTIHYMIHKLNILMKNITNFSKKDTKVIIHCLNGELILNLLKNNNKFSVYNNNNNNLVFFIEKKFKSSDIFKKIDVYFKGGQGLDNVVSEYIVEPKNLIDTFINNGFELIEFTKFIENDPLNFGLQKYELQVSNLYTTYIFNYKNNNNVLDINKNKIN